MQYRKTVLLTLVSTHVNLTRKPRFRAAKTVIETAIGFRAAKTVIQTGNSHQFPSAASCNSIVKRAGLIDCRCNSYCIASLTTPSIRRDTTSIDQCLHQPLIGQHSTIPFINSIDQCLHQPLIGQHSTIPFIDRRHLAIPFINGIHSHHERPHRSRKAE